MKALLIFTVAMGLIIGGILGYQLNSIQIGALTPASKSAGWSAPYKDCKEVSQSVIRDSIGGLVTSAADQSSRVLAANLIKDIKTSSDMNETATVATNTITQKRDVNISQLAELLNNQLTSELAQFGDSCVSFQTTGGITVSRVTWKDVTTKTLPVTIANNGQNITSLSTNSIGAKVFIDVSIIIKSKSGTGSTCKIATSTLPIKSSYLIITNSDNFWKFVASSVTAQEITNFSKNNSLAEVYDIDKDSLPVMSGVHTDISGNWKSDKIDKGVIPAYKKVNIAIGDPNAVTKSKCCVDSKTTKPDAPNSLTCPLAN